MVEPHSSNFRVITTNFLGVRIFRKFTVAPDCYCAPDEAENVLQFFKITVNFLNIRTPKKFVVITLKGPIATLYCDVPTEKVIFKGDKCKYEYDQTVPQLL